MALPQSRDSGDAAAPSAVAIRGDMGTGESRQKLIQARWAVLRKFVTGKMREAESTIRTFTWYGLIRKEELERDAQSVLMQYWILPDVPVRLRHRTEGSTTLSDVVVAQDSAVDNTGNVCVWPSEEVLAFYCATRPELFRGNRVLELGAGMAGLAAFAVAAVCAPAEVVVTDGNPLAVAALDENAQRTGLGSVRAALLRWSEDAPAPSQLYDVVIAADCLFFESYHAALLHTLAVSLRPDGVALLLAPERGGSLSRFVARARASGRFAVAPVEATDPYCPELMARHRALLGSPGYHPALHYPLCVRLQRVDDAVRDRPGTG